VQILDRTEALMVSRPISTRCFPLARTTALFFPLLRLQYYNFILQQSGPLPTLRSLGTLEWQPPTPPQLPGMQPFAVWGCSHTPKTNTQCTPLDAPWDDIRASIDAVSVSARDASPTKVDAQTFIHHTPLEAWDDVRASVEAISVSAKGASLQNVDVKKKGRKAVSAASKCNVVHCQSPQIKSVLLVDGMVSAFIGQRVHTSINSIPYCALPMTAQPSIWIQ
jgi:hypothetical protein